MRKITLLRSSSFSLQKLIDFSRNSNLEEVVDTNGVTQSTLFIVVTHSSPYAPFPNMHK